MKTLSFIALASWLLAQTSVQPIPCNKPLQKVMVFPTGDGGAQWCPSLVTTLSDGGVTYANGAAAGRKSIFLCNSAGNLGTPVLTVNWGRDGGWPTTTMGALQGEGTKLRVGDCLNLQLPSGTPTRCIFDTADAGLEITECF